MKQKQNSKQSQNKTRGRETF